MELIVQLFVLLTLGMYGGDNPNPLTPLQYSDVDKDSLLISSANVQ